MSLPQRFIPQASDSSIGLISPSAQKMVVKKLEARLCNHPVNMIIHSYQIYFHSDLILDVVSYSAGCVRRSFKIWGYGRP